MNEPPPRHATTCHQTDQQAEQPPFQLPAPLALSRGGNAGATRLRTGTPQHFTYQQSANASTGTHTGKSTTPQTQRNPHPQPNNCQQRNPAIGSSLVVHRPPNPNYSLPIQRGQHTIAHHHVRQTPGPLNLNMAPVSPDRPGRHKERHSITGHRHRRIETPATAQTAETAPPTMPDGHPTGTDTDEIGRHGY